MAQMGRPTKEIDKTQFEKLCGIHCTKEEVAGFFDCSEDTIERWCKRTYEATFAVVYKKYCVIGNVSLRRMQFKLAEKSVPMAIFLGKNYLGQTDHFEQTVHEVEDLSPLVSLLKEEVASRETLEVEETHEVACEATTE